ncbi:hypothetical protein BaRGS_00017807 [Batillaria attramentaria]|uniref:Uncharacterized protein n=1 Tax=Batillaria attramentaria TaxID=370345 RepID=A0ABD0KUT6_9CAEN
MTHCHIAPFCLELKAGGVMTVGSARWSNSPPYGQQRKSTDTQITPPNSGRRPDVIKGDKPIPSVGDKTCHRPAVSACVMAMGQPGTPITDRLAVVLCVVMDRSLDVQFFPRLA